MLAFITTLRHPENAADYGRVEQQLAQTLASVTGQTRGDFVVVVVGNRRPTIELPERVRFIAVDFPAPEPARGVHADRDAFVRDKGTKVGIGLLSLRDESPSHVMLVDADDFVHRGLVEWVGGRQGIGWYVDEGWMVSAETREAMPISGFHRTCGTSLIVPFEAYSVPHDLGVDASQDAVVDGFGEVLPAIMGAHRNAVSWLAERGYPLSPLPFRGAVYYVDSGENHSGKSLRDHLEKIGSAVEGYVPRPLSVRHSREYGLPQTHRAVASWWVRNLSGVVRRRRPVSG